MAKDGPNWDGLLKWSIANSDGTRATRNLSEEDRRWFMEAMQSQSVDVIKRMKEITLVIQTPEQVLEAQGVSAADIDSTISKSPSCFKLSFCFWVFRDATDDGIGIFQFHKLVVSYTFSYSGPDLHSIGGLVPLLGYLKNSHANVRAKAAEVLSTTVQNNPQSQQLAMEANGLEPLLSNFTSDLDVTVRTKALGAIYSLIRHNKPGIAAFRLANGYAALRDALGTESVRFQRKALNLIQYLLHEYSSDCSVASGNNGGLGEEDEKLKRLLEERIKGISLMSPEDLGAAKEERQLVDSLWTTYYKEPSSVREKGLLALPGDAPASDVASKHFEPPLRGWPANRTGDS
ncbi:hypothetical protein CRYUN_Cryun08bG0156500 [Craigia yunnanensis]